MGEICFDVASESESASACEQSSRAARRRRMEIRRFKIVADLPSQPENGLARGVDDKRLVISVPAGDCKNVADIGNRRAVVEKEPSEDKEITVPNEQLIPAPAPIIPDANNFPRFGVASVCGRRRDMEDSVAVHPNLCRRDDGQLHYFGVYDGHGCSHVSIGL